MSIYLKNKAFIIKKYGIKSEDLEDFLAENEGITKNKDGEILINIQKKIFQQWIQDYSECGNFENLKRRSDEAVFRSKIHKAELNRIRAEKENLDLLEARKELINHDLVKYYYSGYLEKLNLEIFRTEKVLREFLSNKLSSILTADQLHELLTEFRNLHNNTCEVTIKQVKTSQKQELEKWI